MEEYAKIDAKSNLQGGTLAKHIPFDSFISDMLKKCTCRSSNSKCLYCSFKLEYNFKVDLPTKGDKAFLAGSLSESLKR